MNIVFRGELGLGIHGIYVNSSIMDEAALMKTPL
jgi:hypothetical protein